MRKRTYSSQIYKLIKPDFFMDLQITLMVMLLILGFGYSSSCFANSEYNKHVVKIFVYGNISNNILSFGTGTGFVINDEGYIVTNHHVVGSAVQNISKPKPMFVLPEGQREILKRGFSKPNVEFIWSSPALDLAILKLTQESLDTLKLEPLTFSGVVPSQEKVVKAIGFPGIADTLNVKTIDVAAESTLTSGEVGRLIEDGFAAIGSGSRQLIQHSAFIHNGNSGGPLIDDCGRVVGINTGAPKNMVVDKHGKKTSFSTSLAGYYYAVDIRELIDVVRKKNITFTLSDEECLDSEEKLNSMIKTGFVVAAIGFICLSFLVFYLMRNPSGKGGVDNPNGTNPEPKKPEPVSSDDFKISVDNSKSTLILDGYASGGQRYRLVIGEEELYRGYVVVGRDPGNKKHAVNDESISRKHCVFYAEGNDLLIKDIGSTNGTYVNDRELSEGESVSLYNGAEVRIGAVTFKVISG